MNILECTTGFAVPGSDSIIDCIHPATGKSWINGETLEQIRLRYPSAEVVNIDEHCAAKARRQDTPVEWSAITEERYHEMLNVLPPAAWVGGAFMVGEPYDHHAGTGRPRFQAFRHTGQLYEASNRPMTHKEFCALFGKTANCYVE